MLKIQLHVHLRTKDVHVLRRYVDLHTSTQGFHQFENLNFLKMEVQSLSVAKWSRLFKGKTETKCAPKIIFSANGSGLKNVVFLIIN